MVNPFHSADSRVTGQQKSSLPHLAQSQQRRRKTKSVLAGEVMALSHLLNEAYAIRIQVEYAVLRKISLKIFTYSRFAFDTISNGTRPLGKHPAINQYPAIQEYLVKEVSHIGFLRSNKNQADGLTETIKQKVSSKRMETNMLSEVVEQCILGQPSQKAAIDDQDLHAELCS